MKFKLICEYEEGDVVSHEFQKVTLNDVLMRMQDFLKGCGYVFDGTLDIVPEDEMFPQVQIEPEGSDFGDDHNEPLVLPKEYRNSDVDSDGRC
jgi:hypothetical protein